MKSKIVVFLTIACALCPTLLSASGAAPDIYVATPEQAPDITAYNAALQTNTVEAWNKFLTTYPTSLYRNNALMKRLLVIENLYKEDSKGDGSFFDFHGPVRAITERMFYSDEVKEYRFNRDEKVESGFKRDEKGRINDYISYTGKSRPYFIREYEYGRVVEFGYTGTPVKSKLSYNDSGLLTKEVIYNTREDAVIGRIEYNYTEFDDHGNWIVRQKTVVKNAKEVAKDTETRIISYWGETVPSAPTKTVAPSQGKAIYDNLIAQSRPKDISVDFNTLTPEEKMKAIGRMYKEEMKGDGGFFDFHGPVRTLSAKIGGNEVAEYGFDREGKANGAYTRDQNGHINGIDTKGVHTAYQCNAAGRLTGYAQDKSSYSVRLKYNPYGLLNTEETYEKSSNTIKERKEYTYTQYDAHGNWVERICTIVKNSKVVKKETETRKLTYWE